MDATNPLAALVPLIGIALILLAVRLTGGARRVRLDRALVLRRLAEDLPDFAAGEMVIGDDAATALVGSADGTSCAVLFAAGDRVVVRLLGRGDVRRVGVEAGRLVIDTGDFTHGRFELALAGAAERWAARLAPRAGAA
jgi:hypothetical protein